MSVRVESNLKVSSKEIARYASALGKKYLRVGMYYLLNEVTNRSIAEYMIMTPSIAEALTAKVHPTKLTVRSTRLARSLLEAPTFNTEGLNAAKLKSKGLPTPTIPTWKGCSEGSKKVFIRTHDIEGVIISEVPYAERHEKGNNMPKRPYLEPAAKASIGTGREIFREVISESFNKLKVARSF